MAFILPKRAPHDLKRQETDRLFTRSPRPPSPKNESNIELGWRGASLVRVYTPTPARYILEIVQTNLWALHDIILAIGVVKKAFKIKTIPVWGNCFGG